MLRLFLVIGLYLALGITTFVLGNETTSPSRYQLASEASTAPFNINLLFRQGLTLVEHLHVKEPSHVYSSYNAVEGRLHFYECRLDQACYRQQEHACPRDESCVHQDRCRELTLPPP